MNRQYPITATSTNREADNIFPPFSGELAVDPNLQYTPRHTLNELKEYIQTELPNSSKSKIDSLNGVVAHPFPYHFATFASKAYEKYEASKTYEQNLPSGWQLLTTASNPIRANGYFGAAYWHPESEQVVIAHRGTDPKNLGADWADLKGVVFGGYVAQMHSASTFAHHMLTVLKEVNQTCHTNFQLFFTGHSLGGWLAQITTFTVKYLTVNDNNGCFVNANQEGYHAHTVVFDSPGCKTMLAQMQDSFAVRYDSSHTLPIATLDINSYLSAPNRINTCNLHVGKVYRIFIDLSNMTFAQEKTPLYNLATHSMSAILGAFDAKTGQVKQDGIGKLKIQEVVDWPVSSGLSGGPEYSGFFEWAKKLNAYHPDWELNRESVDFQVELYKKGGYIIRYQTKPFDEQVCNVSVFSQSEQVFLKQYGLLRTFPEFFQPSTLFSVISDEREQAHAQTILGKFTIKNEAIHSDSAADLHILIPYVKRLLSLFPNIATAVSSQCSHAGIKDKLYKIYSDQYLEDIDHSMRLLNFEDNQNSIDTGSKLRGFLSNTQQQVWQIDVQEDTRVGFIRIYKILQQIREMQPAYQGSHTVLELEKLLLANEVISIQSLLESKPVAHLLIVDCNPKKVNESQVKTVFSNLFQKVKNSSLKGGIKIILLTKQDNNDKSLTKVFKELGNQNLGNKKYLVTRDKGFTWSDLIPESQKALLERKIIFQGEQTSLSELVQENAINQLFDFSTLVKLINNDKIKIGGKPLGISDLEGAYAELLEEINQDTLKIHLDNDLSEAIYIISGINRADEGHMLKGCISNLGVEIDNINDQMDILTYPYSLKPSDKTIQLVDSGFKEANFKQLCHHHSDKKIYWINWDASKFILQKLYNPDFYIERNFNRIDKVVIKKNIKASLTKKAIEDKFIFSGKKDKELKKFLGLNDRQLDNNRISVIENPEVARVKFNELNGTVHWLEVETNEGSEQIIWRNSKGSLRNLREYIDESQNKIILEKQDSLLEAIKAEQAVIIADDPGMGKSTTLIKLYGSKDGSNGMLAPDWVIHVNFRDHLKAIKEGIDADHIDVNNIAKCLSYIDSSLDNSFAQNLLISALDEKEGCRKPLFITFDGFDEIPDQRDREQVVALLKFLKNKTNAKVWVTTRLHHREMLEDALSTFAITFQPMDDATKRIFISNYLKGCLSLLLNEEVFVDIFSDGGVVQEGTKMWKYTEALIEKMQSVFKGDGSRFIGVPLQFCLFLGQNGSIKAFKNWAIHPNDVPNFDYLGNNIWEVYKGFINQKCEIYLKKLGITQATIQEVIKQHLNDCGKSLAKSSILSLGPQSTLEKEKSQEIALSSGIFKSEGNDLKSIHQTFEEYFASQVCTDWIKNGSKELPNLKKQASLLKEIFLKRDYQFVRSFIDIWLEKNPLPAAVLKQYGATISKLWQTNPNLLKNQAGYTALHIAAAEGNPNITSFVLDAFKSVAPGMLKPFIATKAKRNGCTALELAALNGCDTVVKQLLALFSEDQKSLKKLITAKDEDGSTLLHRVVVNGHTLVVEQLLAPFSDDRKSLKGLIKTQDGDGYTALHIAVGNGYAAVVEQLLAPFSDDPATFEELLRVKNHDGHNVVHLTALRGCHPTVLAQVLASLDQETLHEVIQDADKAGNTTLHLAAHGADATIVAQLLQRLDEATLKKVMIAKNKAGNTALHLAAQTGEGKVFEQLLIYAKNIGDSWETFSKLIATTNKAGDTAFQILKNIDSANKIIEALISQANRDRIPAEIITLLSTIQNGLPSKVVTVIQDLPNLNLLQQEMCSMSQSGQVAGNTSPMGTADNREYTFVPNSIEDVNRYKERANC